jgi:hypothetical protein
VAVALYMARIPKYGVAGYVEQATQHDQSASVTIGTGDFGKRHEGTIVFVLKSCDARNKALTCRLTVASLGYDRVAVFPGIKNDNHGRPWKCVFSRNQHTRDRVVGWRGAAFHNDLQAG